MTAAKTKWKWKIHLEEKPLTEWAIYHIHNEWLGKLDSSGFQFPAVWMKYEFLFWVALLRGGGVGGACGWNLYILKVVAAVAVRVNPLWAAADSLLAYTWPNESLIGRRGRSRQWVRAELSLDQAKLSKNKRSSGTSDSSPFSIQQHQCSWAGTYLPQFTCSPHNNYCSVV